METEQNLKALHAAFLENGIDCVQNESLAKHSTFCIGGPASLIAYPNSRRQLIRVLDLWRELGDNCPICVIGSGSGVLFSDHGYHGLVVITKNANRIAFEEDEAPDRDEFRREHIYCQVYAECGASLTELSNACASPDRALSGLEFAYRILGTVGGATVTNAGAYGSDMERVLVGAEHYDLDSGEIVRLTDLEMDLDYRHSIYQGHPEWIVLSSVVSLSYGDAANICRCMESNTASRIAKQPIEYPSAGQVFKRPVDNFAGRMIEIIGLKGHSIGGAQISNKHAGFIVNRGGATAEDVMALIRVVQDEVEKKYGYRLESMIRFMTDDSDACHTPKAEREMT